jgi:hypothetical protein
VVVVSALGGSHEAGATLLTFDPITAPDAQVAQIYGDHVASTSQFGFSYGADCGFTPNVAIEYRPTLRYRASGYGDLHNFIYREDSGNRLLEINFNADPGYTVCLNYFDLAAQIGEGLTVKSIVVSTGQLTELYHADWVYVPDIVESRPLPAGQSGTPTHLRINFNPVLCNSPTLKIRIDLSNLLFKAPWVGIDNICFSQTPLPAPGGAGVFALAGLAACRRRRR